MGKTRAVIYILELTDRPEFGGPGDIGRQICFLNPVEMQQGADLLRENGMPFRARHYLDSRVEDVRNYLREAA